MTAVETVTDSTAFEPFASLSELQHEHISLMRGVRASPRERHAHLIHVFLRRAQATGSRLDEVSERDIGQSILDYWTAALIDLRHEADYLPSSPDLAEFDISQADDLAGRPSPFKGLCAFGEPDADWYFGREDAVKLLMEAVARERLVMVAGPSGSGKSSLVLAGLVPHLKRAALSGGSDWRYLPAVTPGSDPLLSLLQAVRPGGRDALSWSAEQKPELERSPRHFRELLEAVHAAGDGPALLIVDQFEELFTLCTDQPARKSFVEAILSIMRPEDRNHVILTIREDFLTQAKQLPGLGNPEALFRVPPFTTSELRHVIAGPAGMIGLKIHESVVNDLVKEVVGDPAALPLLQFTLKQLWDHRERDRITWDVYQKAGRPSEALKRTADEIFEGLKTFENQKAAERIFLTLVQPGAGAEFLRRRVFRQTLEGLEAAGRVDRVLKPFVDSGLIIQTAGIERGDDRFEVAHETLIRNWPRLAKWLSDRRAQSQELLQLIATAQRWQQSGRMKGYLLSGDALADGKRFRDAPELKEFIEASEKSERNRKKLRQYAVIGGTVLFAAAGYAVALFYINQTDIAKKERDSAEQQRDNTLDTLKGVTLAVKEQLDSHTLPIPGARQLVKVLADTDEKFFNDQKLTPDQTAARIRLLTILSDVYADISDGGNALRIASRAEELSKKLDASNPNNNDFKYLIYKSEFRVGDQLAKGGPKEREQAVNEYRAALSIAQELAGNDAKYRGAVEFVRLKVGDMYKISGKFETALEEYRKALGTYKNLVEASRKNIRNRKNVTDAQRRIASALAESANEERAALEKEKRDEGDSGTNSTEESISKKRAEAEENYKDAIDSLREITEASKYDAIYGGNLYAALKELAILYEDEGKLDDAEKLLREALDINGILSNIYRSYAIFQKDFPDLHWRIGRVLAARAKKAKDAKDEAEARKLRQQAVKEYESGLAAGRKFLKANPNIEFEKKVNEIQEKVGSLRSAMP